MPSGQIRNSSKRLELYDSIAPQLNKLLCFFIWVGHWKDIAPSEVLSTKRSLDQCLHIYRHLYGPEVFANYQAFVRALFETYQGAGEDAKIRSVITGPDGDRTSHCTYEWQQKWSSWFSAPEDVLSHSEVRNRYFSVMNSLRRSLGAQRDRDS